MDKVAAREALSDPRTFVKGPDYKEKVKRSVSSTHPPTYPTHMSYLSSSRLTHPPTHPPSQFSMIFGDGLVTSVGDKHKMDRALFAKYFTQKKIEVNHPPTHPPIQLTQSPTHPPVHLTQLPTYSHQINSTHQLNHLPTYFSPTSPSSASKPSRPLRLRWRPLWGGWLTWKTSSPSSLSACFGTSSSPTHPPTHPPTQNQPHSFFHLLTYSSTYLPSHFYINPPIYLPNHPSIHPPTHLLKTAALPSTTDFPIPKYGASSPTHPPTNDSSSFEPP